MLRNVSLVIGLVLGLACSGKPTKAPEPGGPSKVQAAADPRERKLAETVVDLLESEHLRRRKIDDEVSRKAFVKYLEDLDPGKIFLLEGDAAKLKVHADEIDDQLRSGRLELAHEGAELFAQRLGVVQKMVGELLAQPLDSSNEEFIETDTKKLALAATDAELRERWRKRLELEVLERVALMEDPPKPSGDGKDNDADPGIVKGPVPPTPEGREAKAREDLAKSYSARFARLGVRGPLDAAASMMNAVTATFDPHTNYLPPADKANFDIHMSGSLEGIGAVLREDEHHIRVVEIVPGGASWRQGKLEAGDLILSVKQDAQDPVDVTDMRLDDVVRMIRGPKGTLVTLTVKKPTDKVESIAITRDVVVIEDSYAKGAVLQGKAGKTFGYIYLPSFYGGQRGSRSASGDVRSLLVEMKKRKVAGIVLDLRGNGGGLLGDSVDLAGLLIDRGPVVQTQQSDGTNKSLVDKEDGTSYAGPVVVMVDRFSASASEIVAGALQDYQRAVIVGTGPTHGKGTVQVIAELDRLGDGEELGVLKITVQQFFRVSGASTQWQGVVPDIALPDPSGHVESGERELENSLPWTKTESLPFVPWQATWKLPDLKQKSSQRVAASDVFKKVAAQTELLRARKDDTKVPLKRDAFLTKRKDQRTALDAVSPNLDKGPKRFSVTSIDYDGSAPVAARPGGKADERADKWKDSVARDPWIEESLLVLGDM